MRLRRLLGAATAVVILGSLTAVPARAEPIHSGTESPAAPAALWKQRPDGFASLPGNGLDGTTGGQAGRHVSVSSLEELKTHAAAEEPLVIFLKGSITAQDYVKIPVASNKSFIGTGAGVELINAGFKLINVSNVIFRNFTVRDSYIPGDWDGKRPDNDRDGIQLDTSHHVWVDHMKFERMGDGMIDTRKDSDYLTYSWNVFADNNKALGVGWTGNAVTKMTIHHNWIRNTVQRNFSLDNTAAAHVYNNYLQDIGQYGMMGRNAAKVVLEGNYFTAVADPVVAKDPATEIVNRDNIFESTRGRKDNVGSAFDPTQFYSYAKDDSARVPELVTGSAGPRENKAPSTTAEVTVALDGTGDFGSVQAAIGSIPVGNTQPRTITIKPGFYREAVNVWADRPNVTLQGATANPADVVISYDTPANGAKFFGGTWGAAGSATLNVLAENTTVRNLTVENAYDEAVHGGSQALAVRTVADKITFDNTRFLGNQDTYLADTTGRDATARTYLKNCYIEGDVDFLYGRGTAVFDGCTIHSLDRGSDTNNGYIVAPSTKDSNPYGFLIVDSTLTSDAAPGTVSLGRPWFASSDPNAHPMAVIRDSNLGSHIAEQGWSDMSGHAWTEGRFAEFNNTGPGAYINEFHPQLTPEEGLKFTKDTFLGDWTPAAGA
ncbi:pectinesterase family protein [Paenarthrobacter aurescens]|jgi:pectinesterase|uniref:Pectinesterase/pectate lyase protein n=1 Tax=Paenarthrobacter aurescens (strain TC1) TaxID=290340 RepID=A1R1E6_PAEAT|nr:pectinesterase family protein [Paenarthrobacter aurescens]ABM08514.1 putative pectinesterase/pectate lyase protein [Paenarthrobacter aurescens TC1]